MFDVFDKDGGGTISSDEIRDLIKSENCNCSTAIIINFWSGLFEMAGQEVEDEDLDAVSKDIMATIDEDGDGDVTKVNILGFCIIFYFYATQNIIFRMNLWSMHSKGNFNKHSSNGKVCLTTCGLLINWVLE